MRRATGLSLCTNAKVVTSQLVTRVADVSWHELLFTRG